MDAFEALEMVGNPVGRFDGFVGGWWWWWWGCPLGVEFGAP